jgi:hypothetical protein
MFSNLTYQQKNKFLIAGAILFLVLAYVLTLSTTKEMFFKNLKLQEDVERSLNAPAQIIKYKEELSKTKQIFGNNTDDEFKFQDTLLTFVTPYCDVNNVLLREFPAPHKMQSGGFEVQTTVFTVEGTFHKLLRLVYELEQKHRVGRIAGVKFFSEENRKTKELRLRAQIYVQNFKNVVETQNVASPNK